ncbi:hypothetical protein ACGFMM_15955 [Streptomyces sp. NPDC048604]|uniref:hypothetical protein n=1 Tax=Streptomyces sp. NPDC048604 TaxID=3365578 RepID=UPI003721F388
MTAALTFVASALWSLFLVLAGGGEASAAAPVTLPTSPSASLRVSMSPAGPATSSVSGPAPSSVVGPMTSSVVPRTATPGQAATAPATQATRVVRAEQSGRHAAEQDVSAPAHGAQPPLPPPPAAGVVATSYRAPVLPGPLAEVRRERAPPAAPYQPRLSRGPPSPRSS